MYLPLEGRISTKHTVYMSTAIKWVIAVLVVAVLAWLLWWSGWLTKPKTAMNTQGAPMQQATSTPQGPIDGMSTATDTSDAALSQDTAAIDAQMQGYTTDTSNVDASMNDKEVSQ